mgnify:CR=1 FL=1
MLGNIISYLSTTSPPQYDNQQWQNKRIANTVKEHKTAAKKNDESGQIIEKLELKDQIDAYIDSSNLDLSKGDNSNDVKKGMEAFIYLKQHTQTKLTKRFIEENAIPLKDYITEYDRLFHNNPLKQKNLDNLEKRFKAIYGVSYQEYKKIE